MPLPNRHALGLAAVLGAMWYAGASQSNGAAYLLCFLVAAVAAVSAIHAWANLRGLTLRVEPIRPVFAGEQVLVPLVLDAERGTTPHAVRVDAGDALHAAEFPEIAAGHERRATVRFAAARRGLFSGARLTATSLYPLGFFTARRVFFADQTWHVYPRPEGSAPLPASSTAARDRREGPRAEGDDFAGVRAWLPGESQRHIDWKAAARGQPLLTKQWAGESSGTLVLEWNALAPLDVESRLSQLARWVVMAERASLNYGLELPGVSIAPASGEMHSHACLRALAVFTLP